MPAPVSAEETFVRWLVSLPAEADASLAASVILDRLTAHADVGEGGRLRALLEETARWDGRALASLARRSRTRRAA